MLREALKKRYFLKMLLFWLKLLWLFEVMCLTTSGLSLMALSHLSVKE